MSLSSSAHRPRSSNPKCYNKLNEGMHPSAPSGRFLCPLSPLLRVYTQFCTWRCICDTFHAVEKALTAHHATEVLSISLTLKKIIGPWVEIQKIKKDLTDQFWNNGRCGSVPLSSELWGLYSTYIYINIYIILIIKSFLLLTSRKYQVSHKFMYNN